MALSTTPYRAHAPIAALRPYVRVMWELSGPCDDPAPQRMVPDGAMSLWMNFGAPLSCSTGGDRDVPCGGTALLGEIRRPFEIASSGTLDIVGVTFWAGGARAFVDAPMRELVDRLATDPPLAAKLSREITRSVHAADPGDRVALVQAALARALDVTRGPSAPVRRALALLEREHGTLKIATLADAVGLSPRQLERRFADEIGLPPKRLASVLRFRRALDAMVRGSSDFAAIAAHCGYVDQSHLIRDFTRFAGAPPTRFVADEAPRTRTEWLAAPS